MAQSIIDDLDTQKARQAFVHKLDRLGWPEGIPRDETAYKRAGRPLKDSEPIRPGASSLETNLRSKKPTYDTIVSPLQDIIAANIPAQPKVPTTGLLPHAAKLYNLRIDMHLSIEKLAEVVDARVDQVRALLSGRDINEELARGYCKLARAKLAEMRKDPVLHYALRTGMGKIIRQWAKYLQIEDVTKALKKVEALTGKKFSTMSRWYKDDRKPIDINDVVDIERLMRRASEKLAARTAGTSDKAANKAANKPVTAAKQTAPAGSKKVAAQPVAKKSVAGKAAVRKGAVKKTAASTAVPKKAVAKKAASPKPAKAPASKSGA